jgi:APA family basic amino acid/polyamine antiporter
VAFVVGGVIGAGIFVLVGPIGARTGDTIWLAFLIAIAVSIAGVIPLVQLASALPRAGAGYVFTSRLVSPMAGTVASWWVIVGGSASTCVVALTFGVYIQHLIPLALPPHVVALAIVWTFYAIYRIGMRLALELQALMVVQMVVALAIYSIVGIAQVDLQFGVKPPQGTGSFLVAVLLAYNTCLGFQVIAEMGEEIRNARRTIPLALLIGGTLVAIIYIVVGTVFISSVPFDEVAYDAENAPLSHSASLLMPAPLVLFLNIAALMAGLTSLNAGAMALPRELFSQARDNMLPPRLRQIHPRTRIPLNAVTLYMALVTAMLLLWRDIDFYGLMAALGILIMTAMVCLGALRLRQRYPDQYHSAYVRFPHGFVILCSGVAVVCAFGFVALVAIERPSVVGIYAGVTMLTVIYHRYRVRHLRAAGIPFETTVTELPGSDETDSAPDGPNKQHQSEDNQ